MRACQELKLPNSPQSPRRELGFERWPPAGTVTPLPYQMPGWPQTIWRGVKGVCPACGEAPIFDGYLKVHPLCARCAAPLGDMPADDAPPYVAMLVVLHVLAIFIYVLFRTSFHPSIALSAALLLLLVGVCCIALRLAKGAVIGILLKLGLKREGPP